MSLIEKAGDLAKNAGAKVSHSIQYGRLTAKAKNEEHEADEQKKALGQYYYTKFLNGMPLEEEAVEYCRAISQHEDCAAQLYEEARKNRRFGSTFCEECGNVLHAGDLYCPACGAKVRREGLTHCPKCGAVQEPGSRFCGKCGTQMMEE